MYLKPSEMFGVGTSHTQTHALPDESALTSNYVSGYSPEPLVSTQYGNFLAPNSNPITSSNFNINLNLNKDNKDTNILEMSNSLL